MLSISRTDRMPVPVVPVPDIDPPSAKLKRAVADIVDIEYGPEMIAWFHDSARVAEEGKKYFKTSKDVRNFYTYQNYKK